LKSLLTFCQTNKLNQALVTTIDKQGIKEFEGIWLNYIPAAIYTYTVGKNIIAGKGNDLGITTV
jgi:hypothetical protein